MKATQPLEPFALAGSDEDPRVQVEADVGVTQTDGDRPHLLRRAAVAGDAGAGPWAERDEGYSVEIRGSTAVFLQPTRANLFRAKAALERFGLPEFAARIDPETWARSGATLRLGAPPLQLDVLLQLSGVDYVQVSGRAVDGAYGRVPVRFISRDDLIRNQRAAGREKDLPDVKALETPSE